jgi:hypothetical protein
MKHRYEYVEFKKKVKEYKGSIKGPNPSDDPKAFNQYIDSIIPDWVRGELNLKMHKSSKQEESVEESKIP